MARPIRPWRRNWPTSWAASGALLFSTGYMANLGLIQALAGPGEPVLEDRLNHASLIDGALLARARLRRYPHGDMAALRRQLAASSHPESESGSGSWSRIRARVWVARFEFGFGCESGSESGPGSGCDSESRSDARSRSRRPAPGPMSCPPSTGRPVALIATDGVFSMDGDLAPLPDLAAIAQAAGVPLLVDDAHGLGVLGREGRGTLDHFGLDAAAVPILMGTLGKALGTFGAFVAGGEDLIETLIQSARSYIYTTAPPPALAAATRASLALARREEWRRERLRELIRTFRRGAEQLGLPLMPSATPIQPILTGTAERALAWSQALEARGLLVTAIRPPTVPAGAARLRVTLCALHTDQDLECLLAALAELPKGARDPGAAA
jgi:7-keto-8-aminopelargonate synthetase-like enzyme